MSPTRPILPHFARKTSIPLLIVAWLWPVFANGLPTAIAGCFLDPLVTSNSAPYSVQCEDVRSFTLASGTTLTATSTASADLATGELKSVSIGEQQGGVNERLGTYSYAALEDDIIILGDLSGGLTVTLTMALEGSFTGLGNQADAIIFSGANVARIGFTRSEFYDTYSVVDYSAGSGSSALLSDDPYDVSALLSMDFFVTASNPTISFRATLQTAALGIALENGMSGADFGNTASLDLLLPDGYSFRSASGLFLSERSDGDVVAVSEPGSMGLLAAALLSVFGARRTRLPGRGFSRP